eukprot:GFKZ01002348.1.p2 GENE.GFKZ01002348.1~~GFKZ01002348.1.p2  ORF type:complete len:109 (-),score=8.82 GFKZ01002348.1:234-560(-)
MWGWMYRARDGDLERVWGGGGGVCKFGAACLQRVLLLLWVCVKFVFCVRGRVGGRRNEERERVGLESGFARVERWCVAACSAGHVFFGDAGIRVWFQFCGPPSMHEID